MTKDQTRPALLSIEQAAAEWSVSPWSVRAWIRKGAIQPVRLGRRVLISRALIDKIAAEGLPSLTPRPVESDAEAA